MKCPKIEGWRGVALGSVLTIATFSCAFMLLSARMSATERNPPTRDNYFEYTLTDGASSDPFIPHAGLYVCRVDDYDGAASGGAWGGATVSLQVDVNGEWKDTEVSALSSATTDTGAQNVNITVGSSYRWTVSGGSSTTLFALCARSRS